jgi:DNA-binding winged helix-turn-helix (wHTH) protein
MATRLFHPRAVTISVKMQDARWDPGESRTVDDLTDVPRAVVLVGDAAKDHNRIDTLLSAKMMVILVPSLETMHSLVTPERKQGRTPPPSHAAPSIADLRVDLLEHRVLLGRRQLSVSERELAMLATLCEQPGRARSFAELAEPEGKAAWLGDTGRVHAAIRRIRRKLTEAGVLATIESVRGYGFRIVDRSVDARPSEAPTPPMRSRKSNVD